MEIALCEENILITHFKKLCFEPTRGRILNRFSVSYSQCEGEHFERKKYFSVCLVKNTFLTKNYNFFEFLKICILSLGYQTSHTKKPFRDEMFLEISVSENVYPLGQLPCFVLWQFLGAHVLGPMC